MLMPYFYLGTRLQRWLVGSCLGLVTACTSLQPAEWVEAVEPAESAVHDAPATKADVHWVAASSLAGSSATWQHRIFPGKNSTAYQAIQLDGRSAIQSESSSAASLLRQTLRIEPGALGNLRFSWKVPALINGADLRERDSDDSPVRVVLAFEGDRSRFSAKNAMLSELVLLMTGEPLPYATLMYVWGNHSEPGSVVVNSRTDRIRKLVIESGPQALNRWLDYERDIRADYEKAFGEEPGALVSIGHMTDTDNTRQQATAWYGPMTLLARPANRDSSPLATSPQANPAAGRKP